MLSCASFWEAKPSMRLCGARDQGLGYPMDVNPRSTRAARWVVRSLLVGAAACGSERQEPRPATDTGREPPPTFSPQPGLTEWGVQVCAAPELREELGPLERARFGADWEHPPSLAGEAGDDLSPLLARRERWSRRRGRRWWWQWWWQRCLQVR